MKIPTHSLDNEKSQEKPSWQAQMANLVTDIDELCQLLNLQVGELSSVYALPEKFPLRVPHAFIKKMQKGDLNDPLLKQILPTTGEKLTDPKFTLDPLAENSHNPTRGLLHKYRSRVLVTLTGACAVHCRYCFRQHFDYGANLPTRTEQATIKDYILSHPEVDEVLLSGGDPLNVSNRRLFEWLTLLADTQIKTVRLHTRLPVVLPDRVDDELLVFLKDYPKNVVMVIHTNHPNELDAATKDACIRLKHANVTLLNQAVLLKGVNDDADTLVALSHALFGAGVLPYYLHILDKVAGAVHFDVLEEVAIRLYWQLLERLPGYLVPKLVQELPNQPYKTPINVYKCMNFK
ncbi:MAG: EF-P beta-lysylation protein EpmB [Moraxella sp.]|nr:EF-P beta-lysylation protein EpmB [Moraxella sp.]